MRSCKVENIKVGRYIETMYGFKEVKKKVVKKIK